MKRPADLWRYLDELGIAVCLATGLIVGYTHWVFNSPVDFVPALLSVPNSLFWGLAMGVSAVATPRAIMSPALTVLMLLLAFLALKFLSDRIVRVAVVTGLLCAQFAVVTMVANSIHFLEQA